MGMRCLHVSPNLESVSGSGGDVRFRSKADMCSAHGDVRFTPESGHVQCTRPCPLCANSGHFARLLDQLIGACEQWQGYREAERLGSLEVDD